MAVLARSRPGREVRNTYNLPEGRGLRLALRGHFREQRVAILRYLETGQVERKDNDGTHKRSIPPGRPAELTELADLVVKDGGPVGLDIPDTDEFGLDAAVLADRLMGSAWSIFRDTGQRAWSWLRRRAGLGGPAEWPTERERPIVERIVGDAARKVNETTRGLIRKAVDEIRRRLVEGSIDRSESRDRLGDLINELFDDAESWRARRVAETEASRLYHEAEYEAARLSGQVIGWRWLANEDACPLCLTIAARTPYVRMGQPFAIIGDDPDYAVIEHPPAHPHCRCSLEQILIGDDEPEWGLTLIDPEPAPRTLYGESEAEVVGVDGDPEELRDATERASQILGRRVTARDLASLAGAPDGVRVEVRVRIDTVEIYYAGGGVTASRRLRRSEDGKAQVYNAYLRVDDSGKGIGSQILGRQIEQSRRLGIERLTTFADGSKDGENIGYKVWPKLGYDGPLTDEHRSALPPEFRDVRTIGELYRTREGRDAWEEFGSGIFLTFDLTPGSYSDRVWRAYEEERRRRGNGKRRPVG